MQQLLKESFRSTSSIDVHFARFISRLAQTDNPDIYLAAILVNNAIQNGNVCVDLKQYAGKPIHLTDPNTAGTYSTSYTSWPSLSLWISILKATSIIGEPGQNAPLILDNTRLYLFRYWEYENLLATKIAVAAKSITSDVSLEKLTNALVQLFPTNNAEIDYQKISAIVAVYKKLTLISGGPGTGKTTTVAKILALLIKLSETPIKIALAASTGKAAARLRDNVMQTIKALNCPESIKEQLPSEAFTIHRLLGAIPNSPFFRHTSEYPLPYDVVVVDESSMIDLALMAKLFDAIGPESRLIMLGDKDQLASVEAGAVFGEICDAGRDHGFTEPFSKIVNTVAPECSISSSDKSPIADCIVSLRKTFRFDDKSGIGQLSTYIRQGASSEAASLLASNSFNDIAFNPLPSEQDLYAHLKPLVIKKLSLYLQESDPLAALDVFNRFRVLCALRNGPYSVAAMNSLIEKILFEEGLIDNKAIWYSGRPIMVTRNDPMANLFNGDIGLIWPESPSSVNYKACFRSQDDLCRKILPASLTAHETVYAMTIHKAQGSEFDKILLILPSTMNPVLTRELLYTAITRAKRQVEIWGDREVIKAAIEARIERESGLREALWGEG